jgi:hypothetical protein
MPQRGKHASGVSICTAVRVKQGNHASICTVVLVQLGSRAPYQQHASENLAFQNQRARLEEEVIALKRSLAAAESTVAELQLAAQVLTYADVC